ncbi:MAG: uroporphyrinogen decarboxylase family protein [Deltaproteobacteria bacterium]|nr:uroporphyrinogen decarboxylase family protein [Deltaproteobacteria bacterium]
MTRKTDIITDRQRVEALLRREKPDRVPIYPFALGFATAYAKTSVADAFNNPEASLAAQRKACEDFGWVLLPVMGYASFGSWEFGGEIKWPNAEFDMAPMVTRLPVATEEDAWALKVPDVKTAGIVPLQTEFFKLSSREHLDNKPFKALCYAGGPFTKASNVVGPEHFCRWLIKKPEAAHHVLRLMTDFMKNLVEYWKDNLGVEGVLPWGADPSSSNQLISPKQFEQFAMPYTRELNEKILSLGFRHIFCHICGEQNLNLPYWAQIPFGDPGLLSFGHEVELETAAEHFPEDIIIGNLEPAIIQTGTPEEVYEASRTVIEKGKKLPGGFIFSPGCEMPPMAPIENVRMMTKAVNDYGWYD